MNSERRLRDELAALLQAKKHKADEVLEMLGRERDALLSGDLSTLEAITPEKTALLDELEEICSKESRLLEGADYRFLAQDLATDESDQVHPIQTARRETIDRIAECQAENARNGLLLQHRIGYIRRALHALGSADGTAPLYGSDGKIERSSELRCVARG